MTDTPHTPTPADVAAATNPLQAGASTNPPASPPPAAAPAPGTQPAGQVTNLPRTQEELDRIIGERVARVERKYAGFDTYKAAYDGADDRVAQARADAETEVAKRFTGKLARSAVEAAATRAGFRDPADALAHVDPGSFVSGEDVDATKVNAALTELAQNKPYLLTEPTPHRGPQRIHRTTPGAGDPPPQSTKSADLLRRFGRGQ